MIATNETLATQIRELLGNQLNSDQFDVVEVLPVPSHGDRMVRLRTLEELLQDFDGFLVKMRPKQEVDTIEPALPPEALYQADGKLNLPFLFRNAEILFSTRDFQLARNIYQAILGSGAQMAAALDGLGRCFEAEGQLNDAKIHYEESIAYEANLSAFQHLASLLIKQKKDVAAAECIERALLLRDLSPKTRFELHKATGNCWLRAQRTQEANKHYTLALEINPNATDIRANLGALYLQCGRIPEAKRSFQDTLSANPKNDKALAGIASCFLAEGEKKLAHDYFAKALQIELNHPTAIYHLVKCAFELKTYATATRILEEYIQIAPINANLLFSLASLQFHLGRFDDATTNANTVLQLSENHSGALDLLKMMNGMNQK